MGRSLWNLGEREYLVRGGFGGSAFVSGNQLEGIAL